MKERFNGDVKPFADSKFFEDDFIPKEKMISTISFGYQSPTWERAAQKL